MKVLFEKETIEKRIISLTNQIKKGEITPAESGIGKQFNRLKEMDLPAYEKLLVEYKKVLASRT